MTLRGQWTRPMLALWCAAALGCHSVPPPAAVRAAGDSATARSRIAFSHALFQLEGAHLEAVLVEVSQVSANASRRVPVRFLAYFTCDHHTPLSLPVPDTGAAGGKLPSPGGDPHEGTP